MAHLELISPHERTETLARFLGDHHSSKSTRRPVLYSMAGNVAAGKSTVRRVLQATGLIPSNGVAIDDPDGVMESLKGYQELKAKDLKLAFELYEIPARDIATDVFSIGVKLGRDIVIDRGCAFVEMLERFKELKAHHGYRIEMFFVHVPLELALERSAQRAATGQRHFPEEQIRSRDATLQTLLPEYIAVADRLLVIDNTENLSSPGFNPRQLPRSALVGEFRSGALFLTSNPRRLEQMGLASLLERNAASAA